MDADRDKRRNRGTSKERGGITKLEVWQGLHVDT